MVEMKMRSQDVKGLIFVYTGNGKGKTTSALGMALRAAGQGMQVLILQFMKKQSNIGEIKALMNSDLPITTKQFGRHVFFKTRTCEPMDIHMAHQGLEAFKEAMMSRASKESASFRGQLIGIVTSEYQRDALTLQYVKVTLKHISTKGMYLLQTVRVYKSP